MAKGLDRHTVTIKDSNGKIVMEREALSYIFGIQTGECELTFGVHGSGRQLEMLDYFVHYKLCKKRAEVITRHILGGPIGSDNVTVNKEVDQ